MRMEATTAKFAAVSTSATSGVMAWLSADAPLYLFGLSFSVLWAAFAGAVIALAFMRPTALWKMLLSIPVGTIVAVAGVRPVDRYLAWGADLYPNIAFFLGLLAYVGLTWIFTKAPEALSRRLSGDGK